MSALSHSAESRSVGLAPLVALIEKSVRGMDQKLGYHGQDRFVLFYYEPRGEEVIWRDGHSYGFATGAAQLFIDEVGPVAAFHKVNIGSVGSPATHMLLIDRADRRAYFIERNEAMRFLKSIHDHQRQSGSAAAGEAAALTALATLKEITQESIAQLGYLIWERSGKPTGRELDNWLEAEAQLMAKRDASMRSQ